MGDFKAVAILLGLTTVGLLVATIIVSVKLSNAGKDDAAMPEMTEVEETEAISILEDLIHKGKLGSGENPCTGKKPVGPGWDNIECMIDDVVQVLEQSGANVTVGYTGLLDTEGRVPITDDFFTMGMCAVNVHWHIGAEHLSVGEYDEEGTAPGFEVTEERHGLACHYYDETDSRFTTEYDWQYCKEMQVGQTYEIHWPHSSAGLCGTPNQYQTPFYDGVFCNDDVVGQMLDGSKPTWTNIGVQAQVFTVVNDDTYYYPDLIKGMIVDGEMGVEMTKYTGSTTGTSRNNEICSLYAPVTWQVDRKCHLISASSFDKLCADMLTQRDDMSGDAHPHGAREIVASHLAADNHLNRKL